MRWLIRIRAIRICSSMDAYHQHLERVTSMFVFVCLIQEDKKDVKKGASKSKKPSVGLFSSTTCTDWQQT